MFDPMFARAPGVFAQAPGMFRAMMMRCEKCVGSAFERVVSASGRIDASRDAAGVRWR